MATFSELRAPGARWLATGLPAALALFVLGAHAPVDAAPETAGAIGSPDQLSTVYSVAHALADSVTCTPGQPLDATLLAAARAHAQAAAMLDAVARHYPRIDGKTNPGVYRQRFAALLQLALASYEQAYNCDPGFEQRQHLENAVALADERMRQIREDEARPPTDPDYQELALRRNALMLQMPARPPGPPEPGPWSSEPSPPVAPAAPTGYARYVGFFVLRPEIGFGFGHMHPATDRDDVPLDSSFRGIYAQIYAAARFTLGKRRVHALSVGGVYSIQQAAGELAFELSARSRALSAGGLRMEFALHAHPRWFSIHPALEFGVQAFVGDQKFGRPYLGPGLGLCLDREVVCLNFKGALSAAYSDQEGIVRMGQLGLAVDIMRIVDRRKGLASP